MEGTTGAPVVTVRLETGERGTIAYLTVDNQRKLNTIGSPAMRAFLEAVRPLGARDDLRALVVSGAGSRAFIGGADLEEMAALDVARGEAFITLLHEVCGSLRDLPVPVIARIDGYALGAGLEIAASCDLRVASRSAVFGMPEVRVGIPSVIEAAILPTLVGWGRARQLVFLGENIGADEALRWGLVEKVVESAALDAAVVAWLEAILACGPRALRLQKTLLREWERMPIGQAIEAGIRCFGDAWRTDEPATMMAAFLEGRRRRRGT